MVGFAFFIGRLSPTMICLCAGIAFVFNLFLLDRIGGKQIKKGNLEKADPGLLFYPASLTLIGMLFFQQQVFMAIAWGAMAFGDAASSIMGRAIRGPKLPWNPMKTVSGTLAFFLVGFPLTTGLVYLLPESVLLGIPFSTWIGIILVGILIAGWVETIPNLIDDNLSVPIAAATGAFLYKESVIHGQFFFPTNLWMGLFLLSLFMVFSWASGKIDLIGTLTGGVLAFLIFLGGNFPTMGLVLVFFVGGTVVSLLGRGKKKELGLEEKNKGKRSINNALANAGMAGLAGYCAWIFYPQKELFLFVMVSSLAAGLGDTFASELGNIYGKRYFNILTLREDRRGQDGAISVEGSLAALVGNLILIFAYVIFSANWQFPVLLCLAISFAGVMVDSILGASLQKNGWLSNDTVNFSMTLITSILAALFFSIFY